MKSCPTCRAGLPETARVCRACYTVIPRKDERKLAALEKAGTRTLAGLKYLLLVFVLGVAAFSFEVELNTLFSGGSSRSPWELERSSSQKISGSDLHTEERSAGSEIARQSVERADESCTVRQRVRNIGGEPITRVLLSFSFRDASGAFLGEQTTAAIATVLPAKAEETFDFRLPCPQSVASVEVRAPAHAAGEGRLALVTSGSASAPIATVADPGVLDPAFAEVAVEYAETSFCPVSETCEFEVTFDHGGKSSYAFRRDPQDPALLVNADPVLVAHLRTSKLATLHIPAPSGESILALSSEQLRRVESPGFFARWIARFS